MGWKTSAPYLGMLAAECAQVGLMMISKEAMGTTGMSSSVFVCYSNALAAIIILPLIFLIQSQRSHWPGINFSLVCGFFLLSLFGSGAQILGYTGINYSSATLATAILNLIPGFTFLLALVFWMEKLDWSSSTFIAKSVGTIVSVIGAFIVTLYQGPPVLITSLSRDLQKVGMWDQQTNWVIGGLFLIADCVLASGWLIMQASILKRFPAELIVVFYYCFFVAVQCGLFSIIVERGPSAWSLKPTLRLLAVLYSAIFGSAFQVVVSSWCLHRKGPVFVSMFKPLGIVIAVAAGVITSGDTLYLGSLGGATVIALGFYSVMWGKATEEARKSSGLSSTQTTMIYYPLLEDKVEET